MRTILLLFPPFVLIELIPLFHGGRKGASLESAKEPAATADALTALITNERSRGLWQAVAALP